MKLGQYLAIAVFAALSLFFAQNLVRIVFAQRETITICHATGSNSNPYITNHPDKTADVGGHDSHNGPIWFDGIEEDWGDIIPPFDYDGGHYDGKNWTQEGQAIWNNGCNIPGEEPTETPTPTPTLAQEDPTGTPTPTPTIPQDQGGEPTPTPTETPTGTPSPTPTPTTQTNSSNTSTNSSSDNGGNTQSASTDNSQGQVLGASTLAATGVFYEIVMNLLGLFGCLLAIVQIRKIAHANN